MAFLRNAPRTLHALLGAALASLCLSASAQLPFALPGLDKLGSKLNGLDVSGAVNNLTRAVRDTGVAEEIRIGQEFAALLLGAKPLAADARLQRYVNALGLWLALQTERPDLPWTFGVLEDPGFNAFATPGGYIFVTRGLVERMQGEAELAGVLAHEIAHVLQRHHLKAVQKNAGLALIGNLADTVRKERHAEARAALGNIGKKLYASGLSKEDEFEADRMAVVIAARAGYDAYGLPAARLEWLERAMGTGFDSMPTTPARHWKVGMDASGG